MADAPWRCSQCGTVNEPAANSCRTCGRWPSLFDLENGAVGTDEEDMRTVSGRAVISTEPRYGHELPAEPRHADEAMAAGEGRWAEAETVPDEVEQVENPASSSPADTRSSGSPWRGPEPPIPDVPPGTWVRRMTRLIVPLLILLYVLVTIARGR